MSPIVWISLILPGALWATVALCAMTWGHRKVVRIAVLAGALVATLVCLAVGGIVSAVLGRERMVESIFLLVVGQTIGLAAGGLTFMLVTWRQRRC